MLSRSVYRVHAVVSSVSIRSRTGVNARTIVSAATSTTNVRQTYRHIPSTFTQRSWFSSITTPSSSSTLKRPATDFPSGAKETDASGDSAQIDQLRLKSQQFMEKANFQEARQTLLEALDIQQKLFHSNPVPTTFLSTVRLLSEIVTCIRMQGVNLKDLSALDTTVDIYETGVLAPFLQADPSHAQVLEHPVVYTLICFQAGCYIDGEAFGKAKGLIQKHLLCDLDKTNPSEVEGAYDLKDLRIASGLNFLGIAEFSDHSACGGGGHSHHGGHHHHDHSKAEEAWRLALKYTEGFNRMLLASKPVGQLDGTDQLMLQATSIILDNLAQVALGQGKFDDAVELSRKDVANLQAAYTPHDLRVVSGQAQLLRTLLESQKMDEAEIHCEEMLKAFPHPKPGVEADVASSSNKLPEDVSLDVSRVFDELSNLVYQHQNLDYAEKFLQISLSILHAHLIDPNTGKPIQIHPSLARAESGLGLIQLQMKDYKNAEQHLRRALEVKMKLNESGVTNLPGQPQSTLDSGVAEFQHNLALALMGNKQVDEAEKMLLAARDNYTKRFTDPDGKVNLAQPQVAGLFSQLAQLYRMKADDAQALKASLKALELKQELYSPTSQQLIPDLYLSAHLQANSLGNYADAIPLYKQLITIIDRPQGGRPPDSSSLGAALHWLAAAYDKTAQPALAADAWRKAVVQLEKSMGPREVLPILTNLLKVVKEIGIDEEAKQIEQKITDLQAKMQQQQQQTQQKQPAAAASTGPQSESGAAFETS